MASVSDEELRRRQREAQEQALREANPEVSLLDIPRASAEVLRRRRKYLEEGERRFREAGSPSHFGQAFGGTWRDPDPPPVYWSRESGQHVIDEHGHPITLTEDDAYGLGLGSSASLPSYSDSYEKDYFDRENADAYTRMRPPEWMQQDLAGLRFEALKRHREKNRPRLFTPWQMGPDTAYRDITPPRERVGDTRGHTYIRKYSLDAGSEPEEK